MKIDEHLLGITSTGISNPPYAAKPASSQDVFGGIVRQAIGSLQRVQDESATKVNGLLNGDGTDIHTALIATQKASLAFDLALSLRNKALGAYQQIMSMQF